MALYRIGKQQLNYIKEKPFRLEKEIQELTENNLKTIFGLEFVKSEFTLDGLRIDTLAFDKEANAFVIIKYKRDENFNVSEGRYTYPSLFQNNKADFVLEFNENLDETLEGTDLDRLQLRILFVSPAFTKHQREPINFTDFGVNLSIELWEIKRFGDTTVSYEQIQKAGALESIKTNPKPDGTIIEPEVGEIEQRHIDKGSEEIQELYGQFRMAILNLDNIEINPNKTYIAFVANTNVIDMRLQLGGLKMWINMSIGELDDPQGITTDVSAIGHWGNGDYQLHVTDNENLEYILGLVKQSIERNMG